MAARFFVVGGVDTNWSTIGNWSLTSGGVGGQTVPSASDDVTLDGNSGSACVVNTSNRVAKTLTINGFTGTLTLAVNLSVSGSITFTTTAFTLADTGSGERLRMIAAGTWTTNGKLITVDVEIGGTTTFTCTLADALSVFELFLTNTTSTIFSGAFDITSNGGITISGSQTITLTGNLITSDTTTISDACVVNGAFELRTRGLTTTGNLTGTTTVVFTGGSGTWTGAAGSIANPVVINTAGTLTLSGTILIAATTLTYTAGTISPGASILSLGGAVTFAGFGGTTLANVTITAAITVTINTSALTLSGTLTLPNAAVTFAGSAGWTVGTLTNTTITATRITTFTAARTYTITTAFTTVSAAAQTVRFTFTAASSCNFVLGPGATQDVGFLDPTNMDASTGQTIFTYEGVITTSPNWISDYPVNSSIQPPVYQLGI